MINTVQILDLTYLAIVIHDVGKVFAKPIRCPVQYTEFLPHGAFVAFVTQLAQRSPVHNIPPGADCNNVWSTPQTRKI